MRVESKEVFLSYAWGGDSEEFVNRLDQAFEGKGITIVGDQRHLGYKGLIKEFIKLGDEFDKHMKIKVVIHPREEGSFWAEVSALPGCIAEVRSLIL